MFNFLTLIPSPYKLLIMLIAFIGYTWFVFDKGMSYQSAELAAKQNEVINKVLKDNNDRQINKLRDAVDSINKLAALEVKIATLKQSVEQDIANKPVFKNKDCVLDPGSLRLFNGNISSKRKKK